MWILKQSLNPLLIPGSVARSSLLTGLTGYWTLDETSGNRADSSGNGYTLTETGSSTSTTGLIGNAYSSGTGKLLQNTSEGLKVPANTSFTFACWLKPNTEDGNVVACQLTSAGGNGWQLLRGTFARAQFFVGGSSVVTDNNTVPNGSWSLIVIWYDSSAQSINVWTPVDSVRTTTGVSSGLGGSAAFTIGSYANNAFPHNGAIDEAGLWIGRVLTSDERNTLYNSGSGRTYPFS